MLAMLPVRVTDRVKSILRATLTPTSKASNLRPLASRRLGCGRPAARLPPRLDRFVAVASDASHSLSNCFEERHP